MTGPVAGHYCDVSYVMVFAPAPQLTITIEAEGDQPDIHLHAGGQGIWQARMVSSFDVRVVVCAILGGETGRVLGPLIQAEDVELRAVYGESRSAAYIHDRRGGERVEIVESSGDPLTRHDLDELYGLSLAEGLDAGICLLSGVPDPKLVRPEVYRRLAADLRTNGARVLADLSGEFLAEVIEAGADFVKVSHEELLRDGLAGDDSVDTLVNSVHELRKRGASAVVVTRAEEPALALLPDSDAILEVDMPKLEVADHRGAGDSLTAGVAAVLARGGDLDEAIRTGAAAGALNVTRHGLGTGRADVIQRLVERVSLRPLDRG
jgi:1-phosphofructokinase